MNFIPFESESTDCARIGADALLFVMAYGHTISVPTIALRMAEKIAVISIAARETPAAVLRDVNKAIDIIAVSIRQRDALDLAPAIAEPIPAPASKPNEGPMARLTDRPIVRPPAPQRVAVDLKF